MMKRFLGIIVLGFIILNFQTKPVIAETYCLAKNYSHAKSFYGTTTKCGSNYFTISADAYKQMEKDRPKDKYIYKSEYIKNKIKEIHKEIYESYLDGDKKIVKLIFCADVSSGSPTKRAIYHADVFTGCGLYRSTLSYGDEMWTKKELCYHKEKNITYERLGAPCIEIGDGGYIPLKYDGKNLYYNLGQTQKLSKEKYSLKLATLKKELEKDGVVPLSEESIADEFFDENEYALLIEEQHEFIKQEKKLILNDIDRAKTMCKEMGFSEGLIFKNEKFSQCVLDIWKTELIGKKYAAMEKELVTQLAEIKEIKSSNETLSREIKAANKTLNQQLAKTSQNQTAQKVYQKSNNTSDMTNALIKGALGLVASYYLGKALGGGTRGTKGPKGDSGITVRSYRCMLHPTAIGC